MVASPGVGDVPLFDQRGNNYGRVQNGRIDIGAFEVRETLSADFDSDGFITGFDFLLWQLGVGTAAPDAVKTDGDADNDLDADHSDLDVWELQYGSAAPIVAVASKPTTDSTLPPSRSVSFVSTLPVVNNESSSVPKPDPSSSTASGGCTSTRGSDMIWSWPTARTAPATCGKS